MYPVSEEFLAAIAQNARSYYWTGSITTTGGEVFEFTGEDIVKGSGRIVRQCCSNTEIELGGVYASELNITLYSQINRYTLDKAEVRLTFHLLVGDSYEQVPMGVFEVSEANRTVSCLELKAYDYMLRFDKSFPADLTSGKPFDLLTLACDACKVQLAQTQQEIEQLTNGTETFGIYQENDIETWRDLLFYLSQAMACFCTIDRAGKLVLKQYTADPVLNIPNTQRFSSSFSDFITRYTAISSTNSRTQISEYYPLEVDDGLTMNLGINPLLQFGLEDTRARVHNNILQAISVIRYVPFDSSTIGNPALDLGDVVTFSDGQADANQVTALTSIQCQINGPCTLKCVGKNPLLAGAKSKTDKNISGLITSSESNKLAVYNFINAKKLDIGQSQVEIINIEFTSTEKTSALFFAQILFSLEASAQSITGQSSVTIEGTEYPFTVQLEQAGHCELRVLYYLNSEQIASFVPTESYSSGKHLLSLYYPIATVEAKTYNTFQVYLLLAGDGTATVDKAQLRATLIGQGLASGEVDWNGRIEVDETFVPQSLFTISVKPMQEQVETSQQIPVQSGIEQIFERLTIPSLSIRAFSENIEVNQTEGEV